MTRGCEGLDHVESHCPLPYAGWRHRRRVIVCSCGKAWRCEDYSSWNVRYWEWKPFDLRSDL